MGLHSNYLECYLPLSAALKVAVEAICWEGCNSIVEVVEIRQKTTSVILMTRGSAVLINGLGWVGLRGSRQQGYVAKSSFMSAIVLMVIRIQSDKC